VSQTTTPNRREDEGRPASRDKLLRELTGVSRALSSLLSPQDIFEEVADEAIHLTDAELAVVLTLDAAANVCRVAASAGERTVPALALGAALSLDSHPWLNAGLSAERVSTHSRSKGEEDLVALWNLGLESAVLAPLDAAGRPLGLLLLGARDGRLASAPREVVEFLAAQASLAYGNARAYEVAELRRSGTDLLAAMAHDLRTPLTSIKGAASTLLHLQLSDDERATEFLRIIEEQTDRLRDLLDELLDAGQIERGTLRLRRRPVNLAELARRASERARRARDGWAVDLNLPAGLPPVQADPAHLERALVAVMRVAAGQVRPGDHLHVGARLEEPEIVLRVGVSGPAHSAESLAASLNVDGAPPGRAGAPELRVPEILDQTVARGIVEAHGGRLWATTEGDQNVFFIALPVASGDGTTQAPPASPARSAPKVDVPAGVAATARGPLRVLVADDEPRIVRFVRANLEEAGYQVITAANGREAVRLAEVEAPDVVLLDIVMPEMNGLEACRRLREFSNAAVVMLSARGEEKDKVQALDLGADDYLTKPFGARELMARMRAILRRTALGAAARKQPVLVAGDLAIDFAKRRVKVGEREVRLTATEYALLYQLASNPGRVLTHEQLLRRVWGEEYGGETEYLWVHIRHLREKLESDPSRPKHILTERGVGYIFREPTA
jgi:two-component system KDP operon response regulator KdpE